MSQNAIKISAIVKVGDEEIPASLISINWGVGYVPKVVLHLQETVDMQTESVRPSGSVVTGRIGRNQAKMFEGQEVNSKLTILIDDSPEFEFSGILGKSAFTVSVGDFGYSYIMQHASALLDSFRPDVYTYTKKHRIPDGLIKKAKEADTIPKLLKIIIDHNSTSYKPPEDGVREVTHIVQALLVESNKIPLKMWQDLLTESMKEDFIKIPQEPAITFEHMVERTNIVYQRRDSRFSSTVNIIASRYQMIWVPDALSDSAGKFIPMKNLVKPSATLDLDVRMETFTTGSADIIPTTHVVVYGGGSTSHRMEAAGKKSETIPFVGSWPETPVTGRIQAAPLPDWLLVPPHSLKPAEVLSATELDKESFKRGREALFRYHKTITKPDSPFHQMVREYARNIYISLALGTSTSTIAIPLDLSIKPGICYTVNFTDGGSFVGFLQSVNHILKTADNKGEAKTTLTFSNIQSGPFRLEHTG